ncbi:hypothetical protein [Streptomyces sp. NRRL B-1347]|uniref:hypothetical protein n=1 Tax=Streptomyces sp. NRRL B-1347 TaxID=1476877 RepID=UPI00131C40DA|nr:hypothetical protein [Streptomyces sp. NRRL B-1347]
MPPAAMHGSYCVSPPRTSTPWRVSPNTTAVARMRRTLAGALRAWGLAHWTDDVVLVATELVTNTLVHAAP